MKTENETKNKMGDEGPVGWDGSIGSNSSNGWVGSVIRDVDNYIDKKNQCYFLKDKSILSDDYLDTMLYVIKEKSKEMDSLNELKEDIKKEQLKRKGK